jgi:hypothetical protein
VRRWRCSSITVRLPPDASEPTCRPRGASGLPAAGDVRVRNAKPPLRCRRFGPGRPRTRPDSVSADKAYSSRQNLGYSAPTEDPAYDPRASRSAGQSTQTRLGRRPPQPGSTNSGTRSATLATGHQPPQEPSSGSHPLRQTHLHQPRDRHCRCSSPARPSPPACTSTGPTHATAAVPSLTPPLTRPRRYSPPLLQSHVRVTPFGWRWRESNPRPSTPRQGFSGRSLFRFSRPRRSHRRVADGLSHC